MENGTYGLAGSEMKALSGSPFAATLGLAAAAAGGIRQGTDGFPHGLPLPFQSPFGLHHFVDPRLPFTSLAGAFRPMFNTPAGAAAAAAAAAAAISATSSTITSTSPSGIDSIISRFPSAFQPPPPQPSTSIASSKSSPPSSLFSPGQNLFPPRNAGGSPGSPSLSPPRDRIFKMDENSNPANSESRHNDSISPISLDSSHHDESSDRLAKKPRLNSNGEVVHGVCCPICGMPLRPCDLETHYTQELEYLAKLSAALLLSQQQQQRSQMTMKSPGGCTGSPGSVAFEVAPRSRWDTFQRIQRNRQSRIRVKLSRRAGKRPDEVLEEEEDAVSAQPPKSSSTPDPAKKRANVEDEEDIDIVGDNKNDGTASSLLDAAANGERSRFFGPPQFTEADVLACIEESRGEAVAAHEAVGGGSSPRSLQDGIHTEKGVKPKEEQVEESIDMLKEKLKKLEENNKCSKCLKSLTDPVVNINCWHVQCEKCWLISLGTKKSCFLCGVSSTPADLRKVFL